MANAQMSGAELDKALKTISDSEDVKNDGKLFCIKNGKITLQETASS